MASAGWVGTLQAQPARLRRRRPFQFERLEDRLLMTGNSGPDFVHNVPPPPPPNDPSGIVIGQATLSAVNDYLYAYKDAPGSTLNVLANDYGPGGQGSLHIKAVSETSLGSAVTVSADGRSLIYTPGAIPDFVYNAYSSGWNSDTFLGSDSFYYIVEDDAGNISKANVSVAVYSRVKGPTDDYATALEDGPDVAINVLSNDRDFAGGTIISTGESAGGNSVRIAEDGKSVIYSPAPHFKGYDSFTYTVRDADGDVGVAAVYVQVNARFDAEWDQYSIDINAPETRLSVLANDTQRQPPETPRIIAVTPLTSGGTVTIADDGQSLLFKPAEGFIGSVSFSYTVRYGSFETQTSTADVSMTVMEPFLAVDNWFTVKPGTADNVLDVLANDRILVDWRNVIDSSRQLGITSVSAGSTGGQIAISADGKQISYTPQAGYVGDETFSYTVADETGREDTAMVTVHVANPVADPFNLPRFSDPGELAQWLLDQAVARYAQQFGVESRQFIWQPSSNNGGGNGGARPTYLVDMSLAADVNVAGMVSAYFSGKSAAPDHSTTNVQHAGIDEADIVETDGNYLYAFSNGKLVIIDVRNLADPQLVSVMRFDDPFTEMYLQGDRLTLIDRGSYGEGAVVSVLDVSDRQAPHVLERTEIDGQIVDSRAIGDRVHLVTQRALELPPPETLVVSESPAEDASGTWQVSLAETLHQYEDRVRGQLAELALPTFHTFNGAGELVASGLLSSADQIHKQVSPADQFLLSVVTIDVGDNVAGPVTSTGLFTDSAQQIYVSESGVYVLRQEHDYYGYPTNTQILKFAFEPNGTTSLEAVGEVRGTVHDQFSLDEHDGQLRIVTTEVVRSYAYWGQVLQRQNDLYVLEQVGTQLTAVGSLENFAPTEDVKSVRFVGDRAYVVTFRVIDPLFAIDLSQPTAPRIAGAIHIPGFSDYLQPIGEDYVLGFGQDANEITGALGTAQVSLFYVGDIDHPQLVDRMTLDGAEGISSEAFVDHHAIAYFAEHHVLSIPISWQASTDVDADGDGTTDYESYATHSAAFVFRLNVDQGASAGFEYAGRIDHDSQVHRSVRVGDALVTISNDDVKINDINSPDQEIGEVYLGSLPRDDTFNLPEDSGANTLDVLANDHRGVGGQLPTIIAVTQPVRPGYYGYWGYQPVDSGPVGTVEISADGKSLVFTPAKDFFGTATFTYTVFDELHGEETASVTLNVANAPDDPIAVDDEFVVTVGAEPTHLNVLANDTNVDAASQSPVFYGLVYEDATVNIDRATTDTIALTELAAKPQPLLAPDSISISARLTLIDQFVPSLSPWSGWMPAGLTITAVGTTDHGGTVAIGENGFDLIYTPAADFEGVETFTYTVSTDASHRSTATVAVRVGAVSDQIWEAALESLSNPSTPESALRTAPAAAMLESVTYGAARSVASSIPLVRGGMSPTALASRSLNQIEQAINVAPETLSPFSYRSHLWGGRQTTRATDDAVAELSSGEDGGFLGVDNSLIGDLITALAAGPQAAV